jgi:hypothetical protein
LRNLPNLDVFPQNAWARLSSEHVAVFVYGAELGSAPRLCLRVASLIGDEVPHPTVECIPDSDSLLKTRIVDIVGLRVENIDQIFIIDGECNPARHAELMPRRQVFSFLIEDLDSSIGPIANEEAAPFVHIDAVGSAEFSRRVSGLSPSLDELPVFRELDHAVV